jgi:hypothetical protein
MMPSRRVLKDRSLAIADEEGGMQISAILAQGTVKQKREFNLFQTDSLICVIEISSIAHGA